ncbi:UDP-N-acetylmuramoyl-tripeptide--D-alanyl-D-alanine ligase [Mucilaginibacter terrae]|uniref:UDP-N-acetylmuramoyl-tripeptide--D-alanyl-D- alanine ligase n=1 Tax=Mucilaginibacter terrae TaxID=1955052 RepID=UPI0036288AE8
MPIEEIYQLYLQHPVISTDTRKISPGSLFFALKGDKFDANTFAAQALEAGAVYAIIDNAEYRLSDKTILVDDVLTTLQNLARYHRKQLQIPVIGLTGSNGKTTTKELVNAVLSQQFNVLATQGNLNNHIGVPLTILSINTLHQVAVIEMGANHQKEIELLCTIAQPTYGLITNVGKAHLEGFGGLEGVKKGKGELYDYLKATSGTAFVNSNSPELVKMQEDRHLDRVVYYGRHSLLNTISGSLTENAPYLALQWNVAGSTEKDQHVNSQLTGEYNLDNILAAICIGHYFNLGKTLINAGIEGYQPKNNRSQIVTTATNTLICDYYNANPSSMAVAIANLDKIQADHKIMILGDMFEMGPQAAAEHEAVIKIALCVKADEHIFVGGEFYLHRAKYPATFYKTAEDVVAELQSKSIIGSTVLIKGSRGMALERLVAYL